MNLTTVRPAHRATSFRVPWWTSGDLNAFFGLAFNILVNVLTLTSLLIFVVQLPRRRCSAPCCPRSASR